MKMIRAHHLEEDACLNLLEWLGTFFDGASHPVGGTAELFPRADLKFDQALLPQPLNPSRTVPAAPAQVSIQLVWGRRPGQERREWSGRGTQQIIHKKVRWNFWVRAEG